MPQSAITIPFVTSSSTSARCVCVHHAVVTVADPVYVAQDATAVIAAVLTKIRTRPSATGVHDLYLLGRRGSSDPWCIRLLRYLIKRGNAVLAKEGHMPVSVHSPLMVLVLTHRSNADDIISLSPSCPPPCQSFTLLVKRSSGWTLSVTALGSLSRWPRDSWVTAFCCQTSSCYCREWPKACRFGASSNHVEWLQRSCS